MSATSHTQAAPPHIPHPKKIVHYNLYSKEPPAGSQGKTHPATPLKARGQQYLPKLHNSNTSSPDVPPHIPAAEALFSLITLSQPTSTQGIFKNKRFTYHKFIRLRAVVIFEKGLGIFEYSLLLF